LTTQFTKIHRTKNVDNWHKLSMIVASTTSKISTISIDNFPTTGRNENMAVHAVIATLIKLIFPLHSVSTGWQVLRQRHLRQLVANTCLLFSLNFRY
jgi:hypothetical protein